jgi:hypothetical protein
MNREISKQLQDPLYRFIKVGLNVWENGKYARTEKIGKQPIHKGWNTPGFQYAFNDSKLTNWIQCGGNVGLILKNGIICIDPDTPEMLALCNHLPETYTEQTARGYHFFYMCPELDHEIDFTEIKEDNTKYHYGEIKAGGTMVVVSPSIHPQTMKKYTILNSSKVNYISLELLKEIFATLFERCGKKKQTICENKPQTSPNSEDISNYAPKAVPFGLIKKAVRMSDINPRWTPGTRDICPFCERDGFFITSDGFICFHLSCGKKGDVIEYYFQKYGLTNRSEAVAKIVADFDLI